MLQYSIYFQCSLRRQKNIIVCGKFFFPLSYLFPLKLETDQLHDEKSGIPVSFDIPELLRDFRYINVGIVL